MTTTLWNVNGTICEQLVNKMRLATECGGTYTGLNQQDFDSYGIEVELNGYLYKVGRYAESIYNQMAIDTINSMLNAVLNILKLTDAQKKAVLEKTNNHININVGRFGQVKTKEVKELLKALADEKESILDSKKAPKTKVVECDYIDNLRKQINDRNNGGIIDPADRTTDKWYRKIKVVSAKEIANGKVADYKIKDGKQWHASENERRRIACQIESYIYECITEESLRDNYQIKKTKIDSEPWQKTLKKAKEAGISEEIINQHIAENTRKTLHKLAVATLEEKSIKVQITPTTKKDKKEEKKTA